MKQIICYTLLIFILQVACKKEDSTLPASPASPTQDNDTTTVDVPTPDTVIYCSDKPTLISARLEEIGRLSTAWGGLKATASGNKIVFGGIASPGTVGGGLAQADIYDISSNSWSTITQGPYIDWSAATVSSGNKIFFAGGGYLWFPEDYMSTVSIYDIVTNTWSEASLSKARTGVAATVVDNKVFFSGGYEATGYYNMIPSKIIDVYDILTNEWSVDSLDEARAFHAALPVSGKVYFAGGENSYEGGLNTIEVYEVATRNREFTSFNGLRGRVSGVYTNGDIFWSGNTCATEVMNVNDFSKDNLYGIQANNGSKVVIKDGQVLVFKYGLDEFDLYDLQQKEWRVAKLPMAIPQMAQIVSVNNEVYIAGGQISCTTIQDGCIPVYSNQVFKLAF